MDANTGDLSVTETLQLLLSEVKEIRNDVKEMRQEKETDFSYFHNHSLADNKTINNQFLYIWLSQKFANFSLCLHTSVSRKIAFLCTTSDERFAKLTELQGLPTLKWAAALPEKQVPNGTLVMFCSNDNFEIIQDSPLSVGVFVPIPEHLKKGVYSKLQLSSRVTAVFWTSGSSEQLLAGLVLYPALEGDQDSIMDESHHAACDFWFGKKHLHEMTREESFRLGVQKSGAPSFHPPLLLPPLAPFRIEQVICHSTCPFTLNVQFAVLMEDQRIEIWSHDRFGEPKWKTSDCTGCSLEMQMNIRERRYENKFVAGELLELHSNNLPAKHREKFFPPKAPFTKNQVLCVSKCIDKIDFAVLKNDFITFHSFNIQSNQWTNYVRCGCLKDMLTNIRKRGIEHLLKESEYDLILGPCEVSKPATSHSEQKRVHSPVDSKSELDGLIKKKRAAKTDCPLIQQSPLPSDAPFPSDKLVDQIQCGSSRTHYIFWKPDGKMAIRTATDGKWNDSVCRKCFATLLNALAITSEDVEVKVEVVKEEDNSMDHDGFVMLG